MALPAPKGILDGKKVYFITSRGGAFRPGTPAERFDHQEPYLRHIPAFIGLTDVTFIHAENRQPGQQGDQARAAAISKIQQLTSSRFHQFSAVTNNSEEHLSQGDLPCRLLLQFRVVPYLSPVQVQFERRWFSAAVYCLL